MEEKNIKINNALTKQLLDFLIEDVNKNIVISPLSVMNLLAMLADAASGETKEEIVSALGGESDLQDIIAWLGDIQKELMESGALVASNAVCIREDLRDKVVPLYEERLKRTFGGRLFSAKDMVDAVNGWVSENTRGMITRIADDSWKSLIACLMNAVAFDARWAEKYEAEDLRFGEFYNSDGSYSEVMMMSSTEWQYIEDPIFTGFVKPYREEGYSYMALLPKKEGITYLKKAIKDLDLSRLYKSRSHEKVITTIPEYKFEFGEELNDFCRKLGISRAFSGEADFGTMINERLKVEKLIHKAYIQVDRNGTKAAAVSGFIACYGAPPKIDYKVVELDRPFLFAIVHNDTGLPVFVGTVNHLEDGEQEGEGFDLNVSSNEAGMDSFEIEAQYARIQELISEAGTSVKVQRIKKEAELYYKNENLDGLKFLEFHIKRRMGKEDEADE